jgi:peptidyl-prolyl cis-trans isomerase B (cyclophilin B)
MSKIVPVYSEATKHLFVEGFEPHVVIVENEVVLTAPLKVGGRFSLLAVSQVQRLLDNGTHDLTDSISVENARIEALVFKLPNGQFIKVKTDDTIGSFDFKLAGYSANSALMLNEAVSAVPTGLVYAAVDYLGNPIVDANGNTSELTGLPEMVYVSTSGGLDPYSSTLQWGAKIKWTAPFAEGETPPLELVGYYVDMQRVNPNRRPLLKEETPVNENETPSQPTPEAGPTLPRVRLELGTLGVIVIELDPEAAPKTVANFLEYVNAGHYDGLLFHRVIKGFMIQGGGFDRDWKQPATREPIENEGKNGLKNVKYSVAMARTSAPHSATAQFFINVTENTFLDHTAPTAQGWGYAVFGKVVEGFDVVDRITTVSVGRKGFHDDAPLEAVVIDQAVVLKPGDTGE